MEDYLPPIVTKLKADLSDLVRGLAEARLMVRDFAAESHKELVDAFTDAGRDGGAIFGNEFRKTSSQLLHNMEHDVGREVLNESERIMSNAGRESARSFSGSFSGMLIPLLIGALIMLAPAIVSLVAVAISTGVSLGFVGLGIFLLRQQPALVAAAISFKNTIGAVFKDAAAPLLQPLINALGMLSGVVKALAPDFKQIFGSIAQIIEPLAAGLGGFVTEMMPGLKEMIGHTELVKAFADGLVVLGTGFSNLFHQIAEHAPELTNFMGDFMQGLSNLISGLGSLIAWMAVAYQKIDDLHNKAVEGGWDTPWKAVATGIGIAAGAIGRAAVSVGKWFADIYKDVANWLGKARDFVGAWITRILDYFGSIPGKIWAALVALPGVLEKAASTAFDAFFYYTAYGIATVVRFFMELPGKLLALTVMAWTFVRTEFTRGVDSVVQTAQTLPGKVMTWLENLGVRLIAWTINAYWSLVNWAKKTIDDVVEWFKKLPERAAIALRDFLKRLKESFDNANRLLYQMGKDMLNGLVNGVLDAVDAGVSAVKRAINKIKEGAKDALGIHSPSTVFAEMGRQSIQGYIQGVLGQSGALSGLWDRLRIGDGAAMPLAALAGAAAPVAASGGSSAYRGPGMVHTTVQVDGATIVEAITPAAQQRKARFGTTGLD